MNPKQTSERHPASISFIVSCTIFLFLIVTLGLGTLSAAEPDSLFIHADSLKSNIRIGDLWYFHAGDDSTWAYPTIDTSSWDTLQSALDIDSIGAHVWSGIGWFRKVIDVDSTLWGKMVAFRIRHYGASEIYLNGERVESYGTVSVDPDSERIYQPRRVPFAVQLDSSKHQVIAVRYSNHIAAERAVWHNKWFGYAGFHLEIAPLNSIIASAIGNERLTQALNFGLAGLFLSLTLLYLALFIVFARRTENLFYALFTLFISFLFMTGMLARFSVSSLTYYFVIDLISDVTISFIFLSYLGFLYSIFYKRFPKQFWLFTIVAVGISVAILLPSISGKFITYPLFTFIPVATLEGLRVIIFAIRRKKQNAWVIGTGVIVFVGFIMALFILGILGQDINSLWGIIIFFIGILSLPMSMSVYLARHILLTNQNLEQQLVTVQELTQKQIEQERHTAELKLQAELVESENRRKTKELEEARQLQMSMLPSVIPQPPNLTIAAYMNPATEVGGDYYDFHLSSDGTLTVAVGDATGHGLNAGMMVTAAKSLFEALAAEDNTVNMMHQSNHVIRQMNFATLKMAICYLKIRDNKLWASGAGMPPLLIYRESTNNLEEIIFQGMPLGSLSTFPYEEKEIDLSPGDKIILMSDGFPERLNLQGHMLDYPQAYQSIHAAAVDSPQSMVQHLIKKGNDWSEGRPQDDDVTFVVIEVK